VSRADEGAAADPHVPLQIGRQVAALRAEAERRASVRRRRRQTLPAIVAGSATLAGLGLAGSWVDGRLPKPVAVLAPAVQPATAVDQARVDALERQLTADEQALQALAGEAAGKRGVAAPAPAHTSPPGSVGPNPVSAATATRQPQPAPGLARPVGNAPATHATTGASHAH
jgi:hypothetical protein